MSRDVLVSERGTVYHDYLGETTICACGAGRCETMQRVPVRRALAEGYNPCESCDVPQPVVADGAERP